MFVVFNNPYIGHMDSKKHRISSELVYVFDSSCSALLWRNVSKAVPETLHRWQSDRSWKFNHGIRNDEFKFLTLQTRCTRDLPKLEPSYFLSNYRTTEIASADNHKSEINIAFVGKKTSRENNCVWTSLVPMSRLTCCMKKSGFHIIPLDIYFSGFLDWVVQIISVEMKH